MGDCNVSWSCFFRPGLVKFFLCFLIGFALNRRSMQHLELNHENIGCIFVMQVIELDFLYPSEGIHRRWDNGYRITAVAATWDQAAFVLSVPRRKPIDETQETLRTSAFPSNHVKVCFARLLISLSIVVWISNSNFLSA